MSCSTAPAYKLLQISHLRFETIDRVDGSATIAYVHKLRYLMRNCSIAEADVMVAQAVADKIPAARQQLAMAGFFGIMDRWRVSNVVARRILGFPPERTFFEWKRGKAGRVPDDTLRRIGYVAGIWKALEILYSDPSAAEDWVNRPNDFFGGQSPLERMAAGDVTDLAAVRAYVDAARAPWS